MVKSIPWSFQELPSGALVSRVWPLMFFSGKAITAHHLFDKIVVGKDTSGNFLAELAKCDRSI